MFEGSLSILILVVLALYAGIYRHSYRRHRVRLNIRMDDFQRRFVELVQRKSDHLALLLTAFGFPDSKSTPAHQEDGDDWLMVVPATWRRFEALDDRYEITINELIERHLSSTGLTRDEFLLSDSDAINELLQTFSRRLQENPLPAVDQAASPLSAVRIVPLTAEQELRLLGERGSVRDDFALSLKILQSSNRQQIHRVLHDSQKRFMGGWLAVLNPVSQAREKAARVLADLIQIESTIYSPSERRFLLALIRSRNIGEVLMGLEQQVHRHLLDQSTILIDLKRRLLAYQEFASTLSSESKRHA